MRWSIIILMSLSLACTKKEATPAEAEQAAETESAPSPEGAEPEGDPAAEVAEVPEGLNAPELPQALKTPPAPITAPPVVEVLERGQEPRQALHWSIKPGSEQKLRVHVGFSIDALVVILKVAETLYVVTYDLIFRAGKAQEDGSVPVTFEVAEASMDWTMIGEKRLARLKAALADAKTITGSYTLGPRGRITDFKMKFSSEAKRTGYDMIDNLRWTLFRMTPTFPEEAVGQGARWTVQKGVEQGGIHVNQLTTVEIAKLKGNLVELTLRAQQSAAKQPFQTPGLPITKELALLNGVADGSLGYDLTKVAPSATDITANIVKAVDEIPRDPSKPHEKVQAIVTTTRAFKTDD